MNAARSISISLFIVLFLVSGTNLWSADDLIVAHFLENVETENELAGMGQFDFHTFEEDFIASKTTGQCFPVSNYNTITSRVSFTENSFGLTIWQPPE